MEDLKKKPNETADQHEQRVLQVIDEQMWKDFAANCIPRLREIVDESENDSTVVKAVELVLNRAYGKPRESVEHSGPNGKDLPPIVIQVIRPPEP